MGPCEAITPERSERLAREGDRVLADYARILLAGSDSHQTLVEALDYLRSACGADRATVFENVTSGSEGLCFGSAYGVGPQRRMDGSGNFPYRNGLERWAELLEAAKCLNGATHSFPEPERQVLAGWGTRSALALPVHVRGNWYGFILFEDLQHEREWAESEIAVLRTALEMVAAQISRLRTEEELRQRDRQMRELLQRERNALMQLEAAMNQLLAQQEDLQLINKDLREARIAAEAANQAKSEFLSNMSHEIRTPLTAILGWAEVLQTGAPMHGWPEEVVQAVHTIQRNGEHLLEIINGILDLSKIEAGKFQLGLMSCSPRAVVQEVAGLMQVRAQAKGLTFSLLFQPPLPRTIRTDPTRLRQVLINLVGNAIKFTETGEVRFATRLIRDGVEEAQIQFEIGDTGIGMSTEQMSRLFQAFSQADNSSTRRYQGTGLGLAISQRLTELMGGRITVESSLGLGSTFRVTIPTGSLDEFETQDQAELRTAEPSPPAEASAGDVSNELPPARVLLAEDGPDNQRLIAFLLRRVGAEVSLAADGAQAVEQVLAARREGRPFDAILMDMQMPVMDGYEAAEILRREGVDAPIIALTAHAMSGDRERCLTAGCSAYATKPIRRDRLIETLRKELNRAARQQACALPDETAPVK